VLLMTPPLLVTVPRKVKVPPVDFNVPVLVVGPLNRIVPPLLDEIVPAFVTELLTVRLLTASIVKMLLPTVKLLIVKPVFTLLELCEVLELNTTSSAEPGLLGDQLFATDQLLLLLPAQVMVLAELA
jgi:hypothetical protein